MKDKLKSIIERFEELNKLLIDPDVVKNQNQIKKIARERRQLEPIVLKGKKLLSVNHQIEEGQNILSESDEELKNIVKEEFPILESQRKILEEKLKILMLPHDPNDDKNTIVEVRAGTGGEEAALFAANLYRMYSKYAERSGWKYELMNMNVTGIGGFKEVIFSIEGEGAYGKLKYESGVHRVQRVPKTETSGRIHTSAATVAIMPEAEEADIELKEADLKIDTYRASGAGGQHVNKTESAIRITHIPTDLVVTCQDESSQHKNRASAMKVLRSRLLSMEQERIAKERAIERKSLVSTGDRSAKIRTYNYPQGRITDHRINYTCHQLDFVLDGGLGEIIEQLQLADQQEKLKTE